MEETGNKIVEQVSSMKNFVYTSHELSWATTPEVKNAIVQEEQQRVQVPTGY